MRSDMEFQLSSIFEGGLAAGQVANMHSHWGSGDVFEQSGGELQQERHIDPPVDS